jgi:hypothetical protein
MLNGPDRRAVLKTGGLLAAAAATTGASAQSAIAPARFPQHVLRAEWYDLADSGRDGFLSWLHDNYLPRLKNTPGVVWTGHYRIVQKSGEPSVAGGLRRVQTDDPNVPAGSQYVLITAGDATDTFLGWQCPVAVLEQSAQERLKARLSYRQAIFIEEFRVVGPEGQKAWPVAAPAAMQLGNFNVRTPDDDLELARYYRLSRFPEVAVTGGSIGARKLVSIVGWPKHGIFYEFLAINPEDGTFETRMLANRTPPPVKLRPIQDYVVHAPNAPHAGARLWPA